MEKRKALGRGLQALIPDSKQDIGIDVIEGRPLGDAVSYINIEEVLPGRYQPRSQFKEAKLNELIASVKEKGVVQPLLVRKTTQGYEVIAGERRLRAARALGITKIPAIIKEVGDSDAMELALIENIQREDLNPVEEARAYERLVNEFAFTQEKIAQAVGRDRASVANTMRLLQLPQKIQKLVLDDIITMGHAKALLTIQDSARQIYICEKIVRKALSVREAELLVRPQGPVRKTSAYRTTDPHIREVEEDLQRALGTRVRISHGRKRGRVVIEYLSVADLERIINIIKK